MFPQQLFTQWLIVFVDSNILHFYSVDHKKPKFGKKNKVKMTHLILVTIGLDLWGSLPKTTVADAVLLVIAKIPIWFIMC